MAREREKKASANPPAPGPLLLFIGLFLIGSGIFLILSCATSDVAQDPLNAAAGCATGLVGAWAAYGVTLTVGKASAYLLAILLIAWGMAVAREPSFWGTWPKVLGGTIMIVSVSALAGALISTQEIPVSGLLAYILNPPAELYLGQMGLVIAAGMLLFFGAVLAFGQTAFDAVILAGQAPGVLLRGSAGGAAAVSAWVLRARP